jgi:hypothetical protein
MSSPEGLVSQSGLVIMLGGTVKLIGIETRLSTGWPALVAGFIRRRGATAKAASPKPRPVGVSLETEQFRSIVSAETVQIIFAEPEAARSAAWFG